jgi:hypothetical protein
MGKTKFRSVINNNKNSKNFIFLILNLLFFFPLNYSLIHVFIYLHSKNFLKRKMSPIIYFLILSSFTIYYINAATIKVVVGSNGYTEHFVPSSINAIVGDEVNLLNYF